MSDYYLTIKIHSNDRDLLDDLVLTLESVNNDLHGIQHVDVMLSGEGQKKPRQIAATALSQSCYQTEVLERWVSGREGLDY